MKIVADRNIPHVADAFRDLGEVELLPGREIRREHLSDCRCLITRTVTRVERDLLDGTPVDFVGTATIGTDHIDLDYLDTAGIGYSNAAGCNAEAASEYVLSGLFALARRLGFDPFARRAGIVGYGNVGTRLVAKLETLGIECLVNDPPLDASGASDRDFVDLEQILNECDLVSLHVPLTRDGAHPTFHLLDQQRLAQLQPGCLLVNAARGEVVDNSALLQVLKAREDLRIFLDTWEGEPRISRDLLRRVDLATPHIAGYSVEGRLRGTQMVLDAACRHFGTGSRWHMNQLLPVPGPLEVTAGDSRQDFWQNLFIGHFDISRDHDALLAGAGLSPEEFGPHFDALRRVYDDRLEYDRFVITRNAAQAHAAELTQLGFRLED